MTAHRSFGTGIALIVVGALGVAIGAGVVYWRMRAQPAPVSASAAMPIASAARPGAAEIALSPEAVARAGLRVVTVEARPSRAVLQIPGRVEANAYAQLTVPAVTEGRVSSVSAELGAEVRAGQVLAQMFVPEVAAQQREFLSMRAELEAVHARLQRTEKLVALGSVSQQELEAVRSEHTAHATDVESARARLLLLGVPASRLDTIASAADISATVPVVAPSAGTIVRRQVNAGQVVPAGGELFAIANLSTVWVIADVYERDLAAARVGSDIVITSAAFPGATWPARISYLDPLLSTDTRTIGVRADVPNRDGRLRPGMYVEVRMSSAGSALTPHVPKAALQTIGTRQFVYVVSDADPNRFIEREVETGAVTGDWVEIRRGLVAGQRVVGEGSFFLRAERDRLGLPLPPAPSPDANIPHRVDVAITEQGFSPARVTVPGGSDVELRFTRTTDATCGTEIAVPSLGIKRSLPLNQPVTITVPTPPTGELAFVCGMNMLKGVVVIQH